MIEVGDKVRTHKSWNSIREPIEGIVMGRVTETYNNTTKYPRQSGIVLYAYSPGHDCVELLVLDNGTKIHEHNLEKVE